MPVVGALFLLAINRNLGAVHVQNSPPRPLHVFRLAHKLAVRAGQTAQVPSLRQHFGLEPVQPRGQRCTAIPDLLGANQSESRVLREALGIVEVFITRQAAVDRLAKKVRQRQLRVLAVTGVGQVVGDELAQPESFIQLSDHQQTSIGSDLRSLEINLQGGVKRELKWPILCLTHWVLASGATL